MTDIDKQIEAHIQKFAAELNDLLRQAAITAVSDALGGNASSAPAPAAPKAAAPKAAPRAKAAPKAKAPKAKAKAPKAKAKGRKGVRRSSEQLQQQQDDLVAFIAANPGQPMEKIAKALGVTSGEMNRPISKLIDSGAVRREGQRRASKYFVVKKATKRRKR